MARPWKRSAEFSGISSGAKSKSIGALVTLTNKDDLNQLAGMLCASRLECVLSVDPNGQEDDPNQTKMLDIEHDVIELTAIAEVASFAVRTRDQIRFRLNFADEDVEAADLDLMKCRSGQISLEKIGPAASGGHGAGAAESESED